MIIIIIITTTTTTTTPLEFFTSILADGFSLEFEWQQVSSSLQDSSQYSGHPQQCCHLDSLYPSANFQVLQALYYYYYYLIFIFIIIIILLLWEIFKPVLADGFSLEFK